jgi:phosphate uptake regulator
MQQNRSSSARPDYVAARDRGRWKVRRRRYLTARTVVALIALSALVLGDLAVVLVALQTSREH